jgi:hypothetical protein
LIFPGRYSGAIPNKPVYGLPCHLQIQVKDPDMVRQVLRRLKKYILITVSINFASRAISLMVLALL